MASGDDAHIIAWADRQGIDGVGEVIAEDPGGLGEAVPVGEVGPVVRHDDGEVQHGGHTAQRLGHVAAAQNDEALRRHEAADVTHAVHLPDQLGCPALNQSIADFTEFVG